MLNINEICIKFYDFLEPKWFDDLEKFEQSHKIWSHNSSAFAKKVCIRLIFHKKFDLKPHPQVSKIWTLASVANWYT